MTEPIGIVCGSGIDLEDILDTRTSETPFSKFTSIPPVAVEGHPGAFVEGLCGDVSVVLQCGRLHFYEGHPYEDIVSPVDAMYRMGVRTVLFTNAAGGLDPEMKPGDMMAGNSLVLWPFNPWAERPERAETDFTLEGCDHAGAYAWVHGPCYETRAEIAALQKLDAKAVGMSTAPEIIRGQALGMRAGIVSCITNNCLVPQVLTHDHVLDTARRISGRLREILRAALPTLAQLGK